MINIYIVRHGQTKTNVDRLVCGQMNTEMTALGYEQVASSAEKLQHLKFDHYYTSPLIRAIETAKYFAPLENFTFVKNLMEMNTGDYSHLDVDTLWNLDQKFRYQGRFQHNTYPNGESLANLYARISSWFAHNISAQWKHRENILIVGHEATVVCAIHHFLQIPLDNYPSFKIDNGGIVNIIYDKNENQTRIGFL